MRETYYDEKAWVQYGRKTVCYGCEKRQPGCHGSCEEYKQEQAEYKKQQDALKDSGRYTHAHSKKSRPTKKSYQKRWVHERYE